MSTSVGHGLDNAVVAALLPHSGPWAAWFALPLVALALRRWSDTSPSAFALCAAATAAATAGLAWFAAHLLHARPSSIRTHAVASVLAGGLVVVLGVTMGRQQPAVIAWVAGLLVPLTWTMRRIARAMREVEAGEDGLSGLAERVGLPGARVAGKIEQKGERTEATIRVKAGTQTAKDVAGAKERIASALGVPINGVRTTPSPRRADEARISIVPRDLLAKPRPWPGPTAPGASIADAPITLGVYEDGDPLQVWLPGDHELGRPNTHFLIVGMTRTGKSQVGRMLVGDARTRYDVELWGVDTVKGRQTLGPVEHLLDRFATTKPEAKQLNADLRALIRTRTDVLATKGLDQWVRGCGLPYLVVLVEEGADWLADSETFVRIAQQAGSAGICLVVSLQRATYTNLPTDVRSQLGGVLCFGLKDGDEAYALSEYTLEAGAAPQAWGQSKPGYCYLESPAEPQERWAVPARTFIAEREQLEALVPGGEQPEGREVAVAPAPVDADDEDLDDEADDVDEDEEPYPYEVPPSPEPDLLADPHQPIPDDDSPVLEFPDPPLPEPVRELSKAEAMARLRAYLAAMAEAGHDRVTVHQLVDYRQEHLGKSRTWLSRALQELEESGELEPDPEAGAYGLRQPVSA